MSLPPPFLDPRAIENLRAINPDDGGEFLRELIDIFLADTPKRIAEIDEGLASGQAETIARAAHSIKGSSGNFGAMELSALARDLEAKGKAGDLEAVRTGVAALRTEFDRLRPVLENLKSGA